MGRLGLAAVLVVLAAAVLAAGCGGSDGENGASGDDRGKALFTSEAEPSPCGSCHVLDDAGTSGAIGPNLDTLQPSAERVASAMREGPGAMPSFADTLSEEDIDAVAEYVEAAAGR